VNGSPCTAAANGRRARYANASAHSAQTEVSRDEQDNDDGADEPNDSVHDSTPRPALKSTKRARLAHAYRPGSQHSMPPPPKPLCVGEPCNTNSLSPSAHPDAQGVRAKMPRERLGMALPDDQTRSAVAAVRGATSAAEQPVGILIRESVSRLSRQQCSRPSWPRISAVAPKARRMRVTTSPPPCSHHEVIEHAQVSSARSRDCQVACLAGLSFRFGCARQSPMAALRRSISTALFPQWVAKRLSSPKPACPVAGIAPRSAADYKRPGQVGSDRPQRYRQCKGISVCKARFLVLKCVTTVPTGRPQTRANAASDATIS
jgi:hypothetical protein